MLNVPIIPPQHGPIAVCSVSSGKDSQETGNLALDDYGPDRVVMVTADTGHEHEAVYEHLDYLRQVWAKPIYVVKADFTADIERKRRYIAEKWPAKLTAGKPGLWAELGKTDGAAMPPVPADPYRGARCNGWVWLPRLDPVSQDEAAEIVARALSVLQPTGIPFLDLCLWKGRFPSRKAQFCTQFLKRFPLDRFMCELALQGHQLESWQGVRRDESDWRRDLDATEPTPEGWLIRRPILDLTAEDVIAACVARGQRLNRLYSAGCRRVGCMLCINSGKDEILNCAQRWPEHIDRMREWERFVGMASKRGFSTLLHHDSAVNVTAAEAFDISNIDATVAWSKTSRGGQQVDMLRSLIPAPACSSSYGLCDS